MNSSGFNHFISEYQKFATSVYYDHSTDLGWYGATLEKSTLEGKEYYQPRSLGYRIYKFVVGIILTFPICLITGGVSLAGRVVNLTRFKPVEISKKPKFPYPPIGQAAVDFAREKLKKHAIKSPEFSGEYSAPWYKDAWKRQPINEEITLLTVLYDNIYKGVFFNALEQHGKDAWVHENVIKATDDCMKISYAIGVLTLDDLEPFDEKWINSGFFVKRKPAGLAGSLVRQDSYQYRTFFTCTNIYHWARGGLYHQEEKKFVFPDLESDSVAMKKHVDSFYQAGTIQSSWKTLYNDFCDRVRLYVDEKTLLEKDARHVNWTKKDTGVDTFFHTPDTQPT